jgi:dCMP deaminase
LASKKTTIPHLDRRAILAMLTLQRTSSCKRRQVVALIVRDGDVMLAAANGPLDCLNPAKWSMCLREQYHITSGRNHEVCRGLHAEQYVIAKAARQGISTLGTEMFLSTKPCSVCAKLIVEAGITRVVYMEDFPDPFSDEILKSGGVEIDRWPPESHEE